MDRLVKKSTTQRMAVIRTLRAASPALPRTVLEALLRAPKVDQSIAPKRGLRIRVRPLSQIGRP
jgi:hypothetical protein